MKKYIKNTLKFRNLGSFIAISAFLLGSTLFQIDFNINVDNSIIIDEFMNLKRAVYLNDTIHIKATESGVGAHNWTWAANQPWCTWDGEKYIIEDVIINNTYGIKISDSNEDFIIRNCTTEGISNYGIVLNNVTGGDIRNNTFTSNYGIDVLNGDGIVIMNNTFINNFNIAIKLEDTNSCVIIENNINISNEEGISLINSNNITIEKNNITGITDDNGGDGNAIKLYTDCNNNSIIGNNLTFNNNGIYIYSGCNQNNISGNIINNNDNNGIYISYLSQLNKITNNELNNNGKTGLIMARANNNMISSNTAQNNTEYGISLGNICKNNDIIWNTVKQNKITGIFIKSSHQNNISENDITDNDHSGIFLDDSDNNIIWDNTLSNNAVYCIYEKITCSGNNYKGNSCEVVRESEGNNDDEGIPGFDLLMIIGLISIISSIIFFKNRKRLK